MKHSDHSYWVNCALFVDVWASQSMPIGEVVGLGVGCPRNWQMPLTLPLHVGHPHGQRQTKEEGSEAREEMERCQHVFPLGSRTILTACLLHALCADLFQHYQLKTDPGLA